MNEMSISVSASGTSSWLRVNSVTGGSNTSLALVLSGTATASVEFAIEKDLTSPQAYTHDILSAITTSTSSAHIYPATAFRINVSSYTSGTVTLYVLQDEYS